MTGMQYIKIPRSYIILLTAVFSLLAFSCAKEDAGAGGEQKEVTFVFNTRKASTRATEQNETNINSIEVLVFDQQDGNYLYTANGRNINNGAVKTFTVTLRTRKDYPFDLMVLANSRRHIQESFGGPIPANTPRETVLKTLTARNTAKWEPSSATDGFIPMWGELPDIEITEEMTPASPIVHLVRMLARVDIKLTGDLDGFNIESAYLYNYHTQGRIIPDPLKWNKFDKVVSGPTLPEGATVTEGPLQVLSGANVAYGSPLKREIYIFEANPGSDEGLMTNQCLVIGANYGGVLSYYRIDFKNNATYLDIKRNYIYEVEISEVSGPGFPDPDKAFRSQKYGLKYEVIPWGDEYEYEYGNGSQHQLDITSTLLELSSEQGTYGVTIRTTHPDGWDHKLSSSGTTVTGSVNWITNITLSDLPEQNVPVSLRFDVPKYTGSTPRTGYLHIISGNMTNVITIRQNP